MNISESEKTVSQIDRLVSEHGLIFLGIVPLGPDPDFPRFESWLGTGRHAGMQYLANHRHLRADPRGLGDGLQSAIIVALNYWQGDSKGALRKRRFPSVAQYARLRDYHRVIRSKGNLILNGLGTILGVKISGRVTTDSAPILERSHANRAGSGFVGKNTCFIHPKKGSGLLLGEILVDVALPASEGSQVDPQVRNENGGCGTCQRCQVHCPTGALDEAWNLDANKCLAYWSIEHRGTVPYEFWHGFRLYLFGCDICQLVCPYNRSAPLMKEQALLRISEAPDLYTVATMDQGLYEAMFGGTPMTRAKREGLIRNALIAMTVTNHPKLSAVIDFYTKEKVPEPIAGTLKQVVGYATWLVGKSGVDRGKRTRVLP